MLATDAILDPPKKFSSKSAGIHTVWSGVKLELKSAIKSKFWI